MPVSISWFGDSQRMIRACFIGNWDVSDFMSVQDNSASMMRQVPHPVHVIYEFGESTATPRDLLAGYHFANRILPANQGVVVYVNANAVIKAFVLMAKRTGLPAAKYIYNTESREDALRIIIDREHRVLSA